MRICSARKGIERKYGQNIPPSFPMLLFIWLRVLVPLSAVFMMVILQIQNTTNLGRLEGSSLYPFMRLLRRDLR